MRSAAFQPPDGPRTPGRRPPSIPASEPARLERLVGICAADLVEAFGAGPELSGRRALERLARPLVRGTARRVALYDEIVGSCGLRAGGAWALEQMAQSFETSGAEGLPEDGPLLVVSNHPGLADAVALFASIPRRDLKVVAARRPFLDALPNTARHLVVVPEGGGGVGPVREAARHLRAGGALLTFPAGKIEPDPALFPEEALALEGWSESVALLARLVPGLVVVPAVVSGVLSRAALRNPLVLVRRREEDRRWLAAALQMLAPPLRRVRTRVDFGRPLPARGFATEKALSEVRRMIAARNP
ncbi:phospholipid/glycerol acyltransferase [Rubrobacter xylanophilus DSM 9941]|uniref:Phospholipid/glycerol acyltransferase n=1 Tax=Rubrobacter xylanophilus (strain DSM 9941 / JCM 11954 / NBRC 16129 / PRD-1) TaxID=266117 RepID=Q1ASY1_RUBXD|nr:1-acyl-sn-glycerol-3-phosphate acyltransferase [Rubrobacter xylanophilus]ABG05497.1 phospholipid/glycerol acyltransferase [Rubrobacter xylanophilus DSM 9941]